MKLGQLILGLFLVAICAMPVSAHSPGRSSGETLLLIPSRGAALIILENANRFDPLVQRLLVEGEIKRWFVLEQPLIQIPQLQSEGYLNELQIRQLDEFMRR
jgi:hypothetical protein